MDIGSLINNLIIFLEQIFSQPAPSVILDLFVIFGWAILAYYTVHAGIYMFRHLQQHRFTHQWKWVLLAIDIPALNVQTPKAVEQMFAHLAGCFNKPNIYEAFYEGYKQRYFSLEIISIEGYIQFLIRTEASLRDLVEAAVYAQYPDAEITEVEDYVSVAPNHYPNDQYNVWIADFGLAEKDAYPIRTYEEFEHSISKDTVLKDPMGTFLESFTRLGPGEQMWFQIIIEPISNDWKEKAIKEIKKYIGEEDEGHHGKGFWLFDHLKKEINASSNEFLAQMATAGGLVLAGEEEHKKEEKKEPNKLRYMTPGQKAIVEKMENKISKIGFKTKIRGVYLARNEIFSLNKGVRALVGAINQYNIPYCNSIVPKYGVFLYYFFKERRRSWRRALLMQAYKKRKIKTGGNPFVLNIEELATIWHFPMSHVKTPLVQKASGKTSEPPSGLPVETFYAPTEEEKAQEAKKNAPPKVKYYTDSGSPVHDDEIQLG